MANEVKIKTSAKTVSNAKTKDQDSKLEEAKLKKQETIANAKKAQEETKAKQAEAKKKQEEQETSKFDAKEVVELASKVINTSKKTGGFLKGLIAGVIIGLVIGIFISTSFIGNISDTIDGTKEDADHLIDETFLGYTAADFKEAILGKAVEKQDLIVMEQPLEIETTITKAGLGNLEIFSKVKNVTFAGTGIYTVDLSKINDSTIVVDEENKTVTITMPHAKLYDIVANLDDMQFEDTEKGLLAFGDIALTLEDQNELEKSVKASMKERLTQQEVIDNADKFAEMKTWEIFQPLVSAVSNEFVVNIEIK